MQFTKQMSSSERIRHTKRDKLPDRAPTEEKIIENTAPFIVPRLSICVLSTLEAIISFPNCDSARGDHMRRQKHSTFRRFILK